ncbi:MAG: ArgR family transcriptional regulator [Eggerthellales bacterium]|nr:ArgR family transcriptional regulator [Eggerthellales bacterium]
MTKRDVRHDVIKSIIRRGSVKTQRDLVEQLIAEGYECTQATVSRDISDLGLVKSKDGYYLLPEDQRLQKMVGEMVDHGELVGQFVVLHTPPGLASGVAGVFDTAELPEIAGTIAGDDTIFILCRNNDDARNLFTLVEHLRG